MASAQTRLPLGDEERARRQRAKRCAFLGGFSLHADTAVHENDRAGLEALCSYGARGPLALERLTRREDGKLEYRLRKPSRGGATTLVLTACPEPAEGPVQLLERLCAWRSIEAVEHATLVWVDWLNNRRLLEPLGYVPPVEFEEMYYRQ